MNTNALGLSEREMEEVARDSREWLRTGPWKCFHCGEVFEEYQLAKDHFGDHISNFEEQEHPACILARDRPLVERVRLHEEAVSKIWNIICDLDQ